KPPYCHTANLRQRKIWRPPLKGPEGVIAQATGDEAVLPYREPPATQNMAPPTEGAGGRHSPGDRR
ncbi:MAG: hypothetical protein PVI60_15015, partial [Desulfobacteraceae bacterium]